MSKSTIVCGDSAIELKRLADCSVDSVVTDPPYGIAFMNSAWDYDLPAIEIWKECLRVLKPGGHLISFSSSRTYHRMASSIEDAGLEIRDCLYWCYSSGMPKGQNIGLAIDNRLGEKPVVIGKSTSFGKSPNPRKLKTDCDRKYGADIRKDGEDGQRMVQSPSSEQGLRFRDWNTQMKPAVEPAVIARKPLSERTVVDNVLKHGTGGMNIGACRIGESGGGWNGKTSDRSDSVWNSSGFKSVSEMETVDIGKFPMNLIVDDSEDLVDCLADKHKLFYCAKASAKERSAGLREKNSHPTVKPIALMKYIVQLVTPIGGLVLDPFVGSGSTGVAAAELGFDFYGIDLSDSSCDVARDRIAFALNNNRCLFDLEE